MPVRNEEHEGLWAVVFTPFLLDLSDTLTVASTALLATVTWIVTVILSDRMRRADYRGPFELLIRRVTCGTRPRRPNAARVAPASAPHTAGRADEPTFDQLVAVADRHETRKP